MGRKVLTEERLYYNSDKEPEQLEEYGGTDGREGAEVVKERVG